MTGYTVYAQLDVSGYIVAVNSSAFLADSTGWVQIDSGSGDRYHHAQGNYFPLPITTDGGACRYKLVDGVPVECTSEEIAQQEEALRPVPAATDADRLEAQVMYTALMTDTLLMEEE